MIRIERKQVRTEVEVKGDAETIMKEMAYGTAVVFIELLKDDMDEATQKEFFDAYTGLVNSEMEDIRRKMRKNDGSVIRKQNTRRRLPWE